MLPRSPYNTGRTKLLLIMIPFRFSFFFVFYFALHVSSAQCYPYSLHRLDGMGAAMPSEALRG
jgi:hypothetical protein